VATAELGPLEDYGENPSGSPFRAQTRKEDDLEQPAWVY